MLVLHGLGSAGPVWWQIAGALAKSTKTDFERHARSGSALSFEIVPETGHSIYRDDPVTVIDRAMALLGMEQ